MLKNRDIRTKYRVIVRNQVDALQEISETLTPNGKYAKFVNVYMIAAAECIPNKLRSKNRVPWESLTVKKKGDNVKIASLCNKKDPINANAQKLKKAQRKLINVYQNEQIQYIQC